MEYIYIYICMYVTHEMKILQPSNFVGSKFTKLHVVSLMVWLVL